MIDLTKKQIYTFKYLNNKQVIELPENIEYVHQFAHQSKHYLLIKDQGCNAKLYLWVEEFFTLQQEQDIGTIEQIVTVHHGEDVYLITRESQNNTLLERGCIEGSNVWKFESDEEKLVLIQRLNDQTLIHESRVPGTFYGIEKGVVLEYRISPSDHLFYPVQKWSVPIDNAAFLEQGLKTGLSLRNGRHLFKLHRQDIPIGIPNDEITIGNFTQVENNFIPGRKEEMVLLNVGYPRWKKMMAVAIHEDTSVMGKLDIIKVY